jgi:MOSC domain-containing protein YiiM
MSGRVESINTSRGGVPKTPVFEAFVTENGLDGDHQRDRVHHGGVNRAVVLFSLEVIRALQAEGHPIGVGTTGENLTVSGLSWTAMAPGTRLRVGAVLLHITRYAAPCANIRHSFLHDDFHRISEDRHQGWSRVCARVIEGGVIHVGDPVVVGGG